MSVADQNDEVYAVVCYLGFFLSGVFFLLRKQQSKYVRFHAMQSTVVFGFISLMFLVLQLYPWGWLPGLILSFTAIVLWVVLMWKALQGDMYKIPYAGDLAQSQLEKMGM